MSLLLYNPSLGNLCNKENINKCMQQLWMNELYFIVLKLSISRFFSMSLTNSIHIHAELVLLYWKANIIKLMQSL